eukprot:COSAG06_NODE_7860_length_2350_cov_3.298090_2_plen_80_part_00
MLTEKQRSSPLRDLAGLTRPLGKHPRAIRQRDRRRGNLRPAYVTDQLKQNPRTQQTTAHTHRAAVSFCHFKLKAEVQGP